MNGVSQDSEALRRDAEYINTSADTFLKQYTELFQLMADNLKAEGDESAAWWGPQATLFLENFNKKEADFRTAEKNIRNMAANLTEQADAWDAFENA